MLSMCSSAACSGFSGLTIRGKDHKVLASKAKPRINLTAWIRMDFSVLWKPMESHSTAKFPPRSWHCFGSHGSQAPQSSANTAPQAVNLCQYVCKYVYIYVYFYFYEYLHWNLNRLRAHTVYPHQAQHHTFWGNKWKARGIAPSFGAVSLRATRMRNATAMAKRIAIHHQT